LGWDLCKGEDLSPEKSSERSSFKEVVLEQRLSANIKRINPWISDQNLSKLSKTSLKLNTPT
jgi:type I restriction enzyme R subunit